MMPMARRLHKHISALRASRAAGAVVTLGVLLLAALLLSLSIARPVAAQTTPDEVFAFDTRADLEVLADAAFGLGIRPPSWTNNSDIASGSFYADLYFDNEQLANEVFGQQVRPGEWIGASVPVPRTITRNARHDLELTANQFYGLGSRPDIWRGAPPLILCPRTTQNIISLLQTFYRIESQTPASAINYCQAVQAELEDELVNLIYGTPDADGVLLDPVAGLEAARGDLERTADELLGLNTRPNGYVGNRDRSTTTFIGDLYLDLNLLADDQLGQGIRPPEWIGTVTNSPSLSLLNLRHDIELLTDTTLGIGVRPRGWQGVEVSGRCLPLVQSLVFLVTRNYPFSVADLDPTAPDYCAQVASSANALVENPPILDIVEQNERFSASSNYAFAYLDLAASEYMGIMPGGVQFRAVYRNFGESNMMFVTGLDFALYVDRRFTTIDETLFNSLQTVENVEPITYCDANWCNGPGPTPTPTGSGPLIQVLIRTTPQATPNAGDLEITKQLVSWNYIRVTYVQDNVAARTAQVTLEVCATPAENAVACEPAVSVFDSAAGTTKPIIGQYNGQNIYEFRYGYSTQVVIEATTRYSVDVWISDPTIR